MDRPGAIDTPTENCALPMVIVVRNVQNDDGSAFRGTPDQPIRATRSARDRLAGMDHPRAPVVEPPERTIEISAGVRGREIEDR
jgi:low affinity Fe/Cu permease